MITHRHEKTHIAHNMHHPKPLIEHPPHDPQRTQHNHTQEGEGSDAGGFLLGTEDLEVVFEVVADPEGAVDGGADEEPASGPAVDVVEFLVAVAWEEEREEGVFGAEEEDDGELGECEEACDEWS